MVNYKLEMPFSADWQVWAEMPKAELWQAVLLSVDLSPDDSEGAFDWLFGSQIQRDWDSLSVVEREVHAECARRIKIAKAHTSFRGPVLALQLFYEVDGGVGGVDHPRTIIDLVKFGDWVLKRDWSLPEKFPCTAKPLLPKSIPRWPWGDHHTVMLGHLEAAAQRFWVAYDPADPTTANTNATVAEWLRTERKVSGKMAEGIASMLRPDGLPTGPRK